MLAEQEVIGCPAYQRTRRTPLRTESPFVAARAGRSPNTERRPQVFFRESASHRIPRRYDGQRGNGVAPGAGPRRSACAKPPAVTRTRST